MSADRKMSDADLIHLADGCAVLGGGGAGMAEILLAARQAAADNGPVRLIDLDDLDDDALVMPCGLLGAPAVAEEKLGDGREGLWLRERVEQLTGTRVAAFMASEIGGANGVAPFVWAALAGVPVVDADGMGRAFPRIGQVTMQLAGVSPSPCVITDERNNIAVIYPQDEEWMERACRAAASASGGLSATSEYLMSAATARTATVRGSVSRAVRMGAALSHANPLDALLTAADGTGLIDGRIATVSVADRRTGGHGSVTIIGEGADTGRRLRLEMQDEILAAIEDGIPRALVPDIITVLDPFDLRAIPMEGLRRGQRVRVVTMPSADVWLTPAGLAIAGPEAFGYALAHSDVVRPTRTGRPR